MWREKLQHAFDSIGSELIAGVSLMVTAAVLGFIRSIFKRLLPEQPAGVQTIKETKMEEKKAVVFKIDGGFFYISVDPNKDGQNVLELKVDLAEVPDEVISALKSKDAPAPVA